MSVEWVDVEELIAGLPSPPYLVPKRTTAGMVAALAKAGFVLCELDGRLISSQEDLLEEVGKALEFPDYYGRNWDAFNDCVRDLPEWGKPKVAVVWHDSDLLLRRNVHDFVRSVTLMHRIAESASAIPFESGDPHLQLEIFYSGEWEAGDSRP
ncbi:hypothetical protein GCM10009530_37060 [Microbispora corallina]|uniref:Barstar (barnase inhibitor) domain-containing protein n=1 Tax=Microbispora corallina TaxID=83302 RepID=A0ABQ4G289_9ACTN|nr:barstar family protein [Microbispora corallina]GIH41155.1 hypothetical protein Mco01_41550 [Microbispora corallina]